LAREYLQYPIHVYHSGLPLAITHAQSVKEESTCRRRARSRVGRKTAVLKFVASMMASGKCWSADTEVRKWKHGNRSTETEVRNWEEKPPIGV